MKKLGENPTEDHLLDLVNKVLSKICYNCADPDGVTCVFLLSSMKMGTEPLSLLNFWS